MSHAGAAKFVDNACANIESVLPREVVGQELALGQLTEVICHHLAQTNPKKPLVISVHGPPGVGKTYTHWWLARSLYNTHPSADLKCPGMHCKGYKVRVGNLSSPQHVARNAWQLTQAADCWSFGRYQLRRTLPRICQQTARAVDRSHTTPKNQAICVPSRMCIRYIRYTRAFVLLSMVVSTIVCTARLFMVLTTSSQKLLLAWHHSNMKLLPTCQLYRSHYLSWRNMTS